MGLHAMLLVSLESRGEPTWFDLRLFGAMMWKLIIEPFSQ